MKIVACGEGRKGGARFPKPAYIHQLTDEYMGPAMVKLYDPYIHQFMYPTNEFKITDE
jgi:hypothetical protein